METVKRIFGLIPWADDRFEDAWRHRNWTTFVQLWLIITVALGVVAFVVVFFPGAVYLEGMRIQQFLKTRPEGAPPVAQFMWLQYVGLWNFAWAFSGVTALGALITAVPVMVMKELSGGFKSE